LLLELTKPECAVLKPVKDTGLPFSAYYFNAGLNWTGRRGHILSTFMLAGTDKIVSTCLTPNMPQILSQRIQKQVMCCQVLKVFDQIMKVFR
jgi:hypothetical protein